MSFAFNKTTGTNTIQIVDFHAIKGKVVKETDIFEKSQTLVTNWYDCYKVCLGLLKCRSFNFKKAGDVNTCQPSGVMPHLQSDKLEASSDEVWYMPFPEGTATIA